MAIDGLHPLSSHVRGTANAIHAATSHHVRRIGRLAAIVLLHVLFFVALSKGLVRESPAAGTPKEVTVSFITPQLAPPQPTSEPAPPKTVPVVKQTPQRPRPVQAPVYTAPSPKAITPPESKTAPAHAEPVAAAPSPAPAAAPPAPSAPVMPRTITTGIEYLQPPRPEYPPIARRMGEEGKAILRVLVNENGRPERVEVQKTSGSARLDEAARQAILRALFKPFTEGGKAVPAYAIVPIRFQLD